MADIVTSRLQIEEILLVAFSVPMGSPHDPKTIMGAPVMFWGPPGVGKSERIEAMSKHMGMSCQTVYLPTKQPEDLSGIPVPDGLGGITTYCALHGVRELMKQEKGVLFLDEFGSTRAGVQAGALSVVKERVVADMALPPGIRMVGAGNPPKDAVGGWELGPPMANRWLHFEVSPPTASEWSSYIIGKSMPKTLAPVDYDAIVRKNWDRAYARATGLVLGFIQSTQKLHDLPPNGNISRGRAWLSPRTLEMALNTIATTIALDKADLAVNFVEACVGSGFAGEWAEWCDKADLPDPVEVLENGWKIDKNRMDICCATYSSIGAYVVGVTDKAEQKRLAIRAWGLIDQAQIAGVMDIAGPTARALAKAKLGINSGDDKLQAACKNVMAYLGKSGMAQYLQE